MGMSPLGWPRPPTTLIPRLSNASCAEANMMALHTLDGSLYHLPCSRRCVSLCTAEWGWLACRLRSVRDLCACAKSLATEPGGCQASGHPSEVRGSRLWKCWPLQMKSLRVTKCLDAKLITWMILAASSWLLCRMSCELISRMRSSVRSRSSWCAIPPGIFNKYAISICKC